MSSTEKTGKQNGSVNVEGILANFFLQKLEMDKSDDDSDERKRKKHKKHKSKKSKKHRRSRSSSHERKDKDDWKCMDNYSSSEEKDIQRLHKLKRLDVNSKFNSTNFTSISENSSDNYNSCNLSDIPYGPSLETLLGGAITNENDSPKDVNSSSSTYTDNKDTNLSNSTLEMAQNSVDDSVNKVTEEVNDDQHSTDISTNNIKTALNDTATSPNLEETTKLNDSQNDSKVDTKEKMDTKEKLDTKEKVDTKEKLPSTSRSRSLSEDEEKHTKAHKYKKRRSRSKSKEREKSSKRKSHSSSRSHSPSSSRSSSYSRRRERSRSKEYDRGYKKYSYRKRSWSSSRRHHRSRSNSRSRSSERSSYSRYKRHRSRSRDRSRYTYNDSRYNSWSRRRRDSSSDYDSKSRKSRRYSRSKSIEKENSKSHKIDQEKIRQIAQKNVLSMIEKGTLPEGLSVDNFKKEQLASMKAGGKSVQELTDFCTQLSKKENEPIEEDPNDSGTNNGDSAFIHHPFKIKESSTIKLNIKNAVQIPIKTHAEKVAETARLSSQFPCSSGVQHRSKELEWVPVEPSSSSTEPPNNTKSLAVVPLASDAKPSLPQNVKKEIPVVKVLESIPAPPLPPPESFPALLPPPPPPTLPTLPPDNPAPVSQSVEGNLAIDYPVNFTTSYPVPQTFSYPQQMTSYPATSQTNNFLLPTPTTNYMPQTSVFHRSSGKPKKPMDVASVVTQRFKALTKLQSNPNDPEALQALQEAQANIQDWVESQQVPGLFTGSTGVKPLSIEELSGPKHWQYRIKKDQFTRAAPVMQGKGMSLMMKMGWNPGKGLGKNNEGSLEPLIPDFKLDKKGFCSEGEGSKRVVTSVVKDLQGKHPVSALMELCSKRKWKPPLYTLLQDTGPPHKKLFLFKVEVNNVEYRPANPINNKKIAKADAAVICLQSLSVFPKS